MRRTIDSARHLRLVELLVEGRKAAGLTQEGLARRMACVQSVISSLETGGRRIDVIEFIDIVEALGLDLQSLIDELGKVSGPS